jgi:hypothetical protein
MSGRSWGTLRVVSGTRRALAIGTAVVGAALLPLGAVALVTLGPGLPVIWAGISLLVLPFRFGQTAYRKVGNNRLGFLAGTSVMALPMVLGLAYLVLADEPTARLSGVGLTVASALMVIWLWSSRDG